MKINKIDLNKTWDFFNKSESRNSVIYKWTGITALLILAFIGMYGMLFLGIFGAGFYAESNFELGAGLGGLGVFLFCAIYIFILIFSFGLGIYISGAGINNYKFLRKNYKTSLRIEDVEQVTVSRKMIDGFKYTLVNFVYMFPLIILYLVWYAGLIFFFVDDIAASPDEEPSGFFFLYYMTIYLVIGIQFLYVFFIQYALRPVIYNKIIDYGYLSAANPLKVIGTFNTNPKGFLKVGAYLLIPMAIWIGLYFVNIMLVYMCVGIFLLPFTWGLILIISIYIEPHIMAQAFHEKK